ncbi:MAG: hypothetical protein HYS22_02040 [Deltaproteobacteria bacterium]|nr:hypothetical protein [Deltaproteobacteria bacterium]
MINHVWTVVCEKSIIDRETNNISLDALEQLNIKIPPSPEEVKGVIYPGKIEIVSLWYRDQGEKGIRGKGQLKIEAPNSNVVGTANIDINLTESHRCRTLVRLEGLPIPKSASGLFCFMVSLESDNKWIEVARVPLEVDVKLIAS